MSPNPAQKSNSVDGQCRKRSEKIVKVEAIAISAYPVKRKNPLTSVVNGLLKVETMGKQHASFLTSRSNRSYVDPALPRICHIH